MSQAIRSILILGGLMLAVLSCKPAPEPTGSALRSDSSGDCPCSDLQCWRDKSDRATVQQLECARDALQSAATLASGAAGPILEVTTGVLDISLALQNEQLYGVLSNISRGVEVAANALGPGTQSLTDCVSGSVNVVKNAFDLINTMKNYSASNGTDSVTDVVKAWNAGMDGNHNFARVMLGCLDAAGQLGDAEGVQAFRKFMSGWQRVLGGIQAAIAVVNCGPKILNGGRVLVQNTACLVDDLRALSASNAAVQAAAQQPVPQPPRVSDTPEECAGLASRAAHRAGQYCAAGMASSTYWWNSSIRRDCESCCGRTTDPYMRTGNQCGFTDDVVANMTSVCTERCYMAAGGT